VRILHLIAEFGAGGAERVVLGLVTSQRAQGHELGLVADAGFLDAALPAGVRRYVLADRGRSAHGVLAGALATAVAIRRFRPDVVHTHGVRVLATAMVARGLAGWRAPVLATHHNTAPGELGMTTRILGRADHVVAVSAVLRDRLVAAGMPPARVSTVLNAIEPSVPLSPEARRALDDELGLAGRRVVALVGRLEPVKRPELFVEAAAAVVRQDAGVRFLVVGDGALRAASEALAARLGVAGQVVFCGVRHDARDIVARADVLVSTSEWEGLPIVGLEALEAGTPIVATDTDGFRELLADGVGTLVAEHTPERLAEAILATLERGEHDGARGRLLVARGFAPEAMRDAYGERYAALLA
jgi:glycosyltransferase involved in cell wall biosynthesis